MKRRIIFVCTKCNGVCFIAISLSFLPLQGMTLHGSVSIPLPGHTGFPPYNAFLQSRRLSYDPLLQGFEQPDHGVHSFQDASTEIRCN